MAPLAPTPLTPLGIVVLVFCALTVLVLSVLHVCLTLTGKLGWHHPVPQLAALAVPVGVLSLPVELVGGVLAAVAWPHALSTVALVVALLLALSLALLFRPDFSRPPRTSSTTVSSSSPRPARLSSLSASASSAWPARSDSIVVMSLNCRYGRAQAREIVTAVSQHNVSALCLVEATDQLLAALDDAGIASFLPHRVVGAKNGKENGGFNVVFCAFPPLHADPSSVRIPAANVPVLTFRALGKRIAVAAAHPYSPQRGAKEWGLGIAQLSALPSAVFSRHADALVIAGDFNSNVSHPTFRWLLSGGLLPGNYLDGEPEVSFIAARAHSRSRSQTSSPVPHSPQLIDSSFEAGKRGVKHSFLSRRFFRSPATFPANWPVLPAMMELDHVLHTDALKCTELRSLRIPGSDHKALLARLEVVKPADEETAD